MKGKGSGGHHAKGTKKGRKYGRNFPGRERRVLSKYVARMKARGTFRLRKSKKGNHV